MPAEEMQRIPVQSHEIAVVGYQADSRVLEITFRRGGVYHYFDVPQQVHEEFLKAVSLGNYFATEIKERFRYKKIC
jgi:hypothetical protein